MLRPALLLTVLTLSPAALADEVRDVRLLAGGEQVWIALDGQPDALVYEMQAGALRIDLAGFDPAAVRSILPRGRGPIATLQIAPGEAAARIELSGSWETAHAELREGGVLIDFSSAAHTQALAQAAARATERSDRGGPTTREVAEASSQATASSAANDEIVGEGPRRYAEAAGAAANGEADTPMIAQSGSELSYASAERARADAGGEGAARQNAQPVTGFQIGEPVIDESTPPGGLWLMEPDEPASTPTPSTRQPAGDAASETETSAGESPAGDAQTEPEVDVSSIPGETELVEAQEDLAGPCDPTAAAVASSPWDLDALSDHAACLIGIGETVNGAGLYERVLAFDPGHFEAALGLARLRERQGRSGDAARLFETAADAARTDGQALAARAAARRLRESN